MFWKTVLANKNKKGKKRRGNTVNKIAIYSCFVFTLLFLFFFRVVGKFFPAKRYYNDKFKEHNENTRTVIIDLRSLYHLSEFPLLLFFLFFLFSHLKKVNQCLPLVGGRGEKEKDKRLLPKKSVSFIHSFIPSSMPLPQCLHSAQLSFIGNFVPFCSVGRQLEERVVRRKNV